jgi:hypothetical protein
MPVTIQRWKMYFHLVGTTLNTAGAFLLFFIWSPSEVSKSLILYSLLPFGLCWLALTPLMIIMSSIMYQSSQHEDIITHYAKVDDSYHLTPENSDEE